MVYYIKNGKNTQNNEVYNFALFGSGLQHICMLWVLYFKRDIDKLEWNESEKMVRKLKKHVLKSSFKG